MAFDETQTKKAMERFMFYPKTQTLIDHTLPVVQVTYTCSPTRCDFREAINKIQENPEIRAYDPNKLLERLVLTIDHNQSDFIPHRLDGFRFYRCFIDLVHLQRLDDNGTPVQNGHTGFVEYNDMVAELRRLNTPYTRPNWPLNWFF